jgi:hypothetical protein
MLVNIILFIIRRPPGRLFLCLDFLYPDPTGVVTLINSPRGLPPRPLRRFDGPGLKNPEEEVGLFKAEEMRYFCPGHVRSVHVMPGELRTGTVQQNL